MSIRHLSNVKRQSLEKVIKKARVISEIGVTEELDRLGIMKDKIPGHLSDDEKFLRRRLRIHARSIGDFLNNEKQLPLKLIEATAYAHWHRLLFARFLAVRGFLHSPDYGVPVTLDDCREIADKEGNADVWSIAERFASQMLPGIFKPEDPVLELKVEPRHSQNLQELVLEIEESIFFADDSLGWTYQFWRASEKEAINASDEKIGSSQLPAVTQLFTEPYMVKFLLHNTLGAWWATKVIAATPELAVNAENEQTLRAACSFDDYEFNMLRFIKDSKTKQWKPVVGNFENWVKEAKELKILDPCCGSGHFLTEALIIISKIREKEENISIDKAISNTLRENLFGLELDERCVQIASFSVALTSWQLGNWNNKLPNPNIAWVGAIPPIKNKDKFVALAGELSVLRHAFSTLHDLFSDAPDFGSLLETDGEDLFGLEQKTIIDANLDELRNRVSGVEPEQVEGIISARGMMGAAQILFEKYDFVITNVPFLKSGHQNEKLKSFCKNNYPDSKFDLATTFMERTIKMLKKGGYSAIVTQQNWLFGKYFSKLRGKILEESSIKLIAKLGSRAFVQISGDVVNVDLQIIEKENLTANHYCYGMEMEDNSIISEKVKQLIDGEVVGVLQKSMLGYPDKRIIFSEYNNQIPRLSLYADYGKGSATGDDNQYIRKFWELSDILDGHEFWLSRPDGQQLVSGRDEVVLWRRPNHDPSVEKGYRFHGQRVLGKLGIAIGCAGKLSFTPYFGELFSGKVVVILPRNNSDLELIWSYCNSHEFEKSIRLIDKRFALSAGTFTQVPFDYESIKKNYNSHSEIRKVYSNDPRQWIFHGHPADAMKGTTLHVVLARICGFRWPSEKNKISNLSQETIHWIEKTLYLPEVDSDGLLCLPAVTGRKSLAELIRTYLKTLYGSEWSESLEFTLVAESDDLFSVTSGQNKSIEKWLRNRAFKQHCKLFANRPFLWQISDKLSDGFSVFVNYHLLDSEKLQKLTYTLLGDWILRAKADNKMLLHEKGIELQNKLAKILEGEKPYDIFARWKSIETLPIGWNPDLEDGVRQNIRPFIFADVLQFDLSKILSEMDRGTVIEAAPWYKEFNGKRINNYHTSLEEKLKTQKMMV